MSSDPRTVPRTGRSDDLHGLLQRHTQRLLGATIGLSDEQWREPSRLPGWSRAHVATHVARQADALRRVAHGARTGEPASMYPSAEARDAEIAAGADRPGLELQIDLDTSAGALDQELEALAEGVAEDAAVELRGGLRVPVRRLPLVRLNEVVLHHVDLDVGYDPTDLEDEVAGWLLEWCAFRLRLIPDYPRLTLVPPDAPAVELGHRGEPVTVSGPANLLLGWVTRRCDGNGLTGADAVDLPSFG